MSNSARESLRRITIRERSPNADFLQHPPIQGVTKPIFDTLAARFPTYVVASYRIELKLPIGHPHLDEVMACAIELGLTPQKHRADVPAQVEIMDYRAYSENEVSSASLLECERESPFIASVDFNPDSACLGLHVVRDAYVKRSARREFGSMVNLFHLLAVRGATRRLIESAGLRGLSLLPLPLESATGNWPENIEPLHLIWSDHMLPAVDSDLFDNQKKVFRSHERDFENLSSECYLLDGHDVSPRLRYSELDPSAFDVAITRERFGGKHQGYHKLVYSQKARSVLQSIDKHLIFKPVQIG